MIEITIPGILLGYFLHLTHLYYLEVEFAGTPSRSCGVDVPRVL